VSLDAAARRSIRANYAGYARRFSDGATVLELLDALEAAEGERDALLAANAELQRVVASLSARLDCYPCAAVVIGINRGHSCEEHGKGSP